jgi:hypothetical protein
MLYKIIFISENSLFLSSENVGKLCSNGLLGVFWWGIGEGLW